jgi:hypothetical protein
MPYVEGDEALFTPRPDMAAEMAAGGHDWSAGAPGPTWTLHTDAGDVVGMGGGIRDASGFWLVWCALAPLQMRQWPAAFRVARFVMARLADAGPRNFSATVRCGLKGGVGALQRLGFEFCARLGGPMGQEYAVMWRKAP